jgi:hypothetical protein
MGACAGWLSARRDAGGPLLGGNGLIDEGGSGVLHITAGCAALMGAYFIGPRTGRFHTDGSVLPLKGDAAAGDAAAMLPAAAWPGRSSGCLPCLMHEHVATNYLSYAGHQPPAEQQRAHSSSQITSNLILKRMKCTPHALLPAQARQWCCHLWAPCSCGSAGLAWCQATPG